jgi:hypothetical protein
MSYRQKKINLQSAVDERIAAASRGVTGVVAVSLVWFGVKSC